MKYQLLLISFLSFTTFSQQGVVSGTLSDESGSLPGVSIIIKGTSIGTETDFDGNYSIACNVGDTLVISYLGYKTNEVLVTAIMFGKTDNNVKYTSVKLVQSNAYTSAIKKTAKKNSFVPSIGNSVLTYNKNNSYFQYNRIKEISIKPNKVKLTYFNPDIYFEVGYTSSSGVQFVKNDNLPELQNTFSQGLSLGGNLAFQGAETGTIFSYGLPLSSLEFDGNNYIYDTNGLLVNKGNGNGNAAIAYDNSILKTVVNNSNHVFFNVNTSSEIVAVDFTNKNAKDIYGKERSTSNKFTLKYKRKAKIKKVGWNSFITYSNTIDNQPNINGFQNNVLLNQWATPPTFSNKQGAILANNSQRNFGSLFNNPEWLLNYNRNAVKEKLFVASVQNNLRLNDHFKLGSKLSYINNKEIQKFGLVSETIGFENGYLSDKNIENEKLNAVVNFEYKKHKNDAEVDIKSIVNYNYENLKYSFLEANGFESFMFNNPQNSTKTNQSKSRKTVTVFNQFRYKIDDVGEVKFVNNSYYSSVQNKKWFLPSLLLKLNLGELLDLYDHNINKFSIATNASFDVNDMPLYYSNLSHNSLLLSPEESLNYTTNNDLFINPSIKLEEKESYEISTSFGMYFYDGNLDFDFTYFNTKTKGSVFPIVTGNSFQLKNVADIRNSGIEFSLESRIRIADELDYSPKVSFSTYRTKVLKLHDNRNQIPIAGFTSISKNLIVGQPAGVLVGSVYARDSQNNIIIEDNGFPLVDATPQIIGNPIPDYNIGFSNNFKWKKFEFDIVIDAQKGGDIWNGTQNVLNYLGTSQQSADQRGITNFIFNGVNQQGNTNTTQVDFYNPNNSISENRFVRYGFEGVAEDAIVDASYINIKSLNFSYSLLDNNYENRFLHECKITFYAKNIFTWTNFKGHTPYGSIYGNTSGQGLNFFNTPLRSEVGLTLKLKI